MIEKNLKGTWSQALLGFLFPLGLLLVFRWAFYEPFVIPSSSMVPNLLIHDHIIVSKFSYGLKIPFIDNWLIQFSSPQRGDIIVFKYPKNPNVFYVKRLIGLPGDKIEISSEQLKVNGVELKLESRSEQSIKEETEDAPLFNYFYESNESVKYIIRHSKDDLQSSLSEYVVPDGQYFMLGDNRDQSSDSRFWGTVSDNLLIGKVKYIWLSCTETLDSAPMICDPSKIRWQRIFKRVL